MKEIVSDTKLIAACGLYCGACKKYIMCKCPGCSENIKATWCNIRKCCKENGYHTCAECSMNTKDCKKFNNFISKIFSLIFRSDRNACISYIKEKGELQYANDMAERKQQTIKRNAR